MGRPFHIPLTTLSNSQKELSPLHLQNPERPDNLDRGNHAAFQGGFEKNYPEWIYLWGYRRSHF